MGGLLRRRVNNTTELEHVGVESHARKIAAGAFARSLRQSNELPLLSGAPAAYALAQYLGWNFFQPGCELGLELRRRVVKRRDDDLLRLVAQEHAPLGRKKAVFVNFTVVDESLAANPACQRNGRPFLLGGAIRRRKAVSSKRDG